MASMAIDLYGCHAGWITGFFGSPMRPSAETAQKAAVVRILVGHCGTKQGTQKAHWHHRISSPVMAFQKGLPSGNLT